MLLAPVLKIIGFISRTKLNWRSVETSSQSSQVSLSNRERYKYSFEPVDSVIRSLSIQFDGGAISIHRLFLQSDFNAKRNLRLAGLGG